MKWKFIDSGFNTGRLNMDLDINLVEQASNDQAILRFYRWKPYCISLGANQKTDILLLAKASEENIDVVTRPTGGRAILHAEELTYSVVFPIDDTNSVRKIYNEINCALVIGLKNYDSGLENVETETLQPDFREVYKQVKGEVCFSILAKNEIKFKGKKLVGSAQRKYGKFVLQHGSILCGKYHRKIVDYLNVTGRDKDEINYELDNNTIELESILFKEVDYGKLLESIVEGFEEYFKMRFINSIDQSNKIIYSV